MNICYNQGIKHRHYTQKGEIQMKKHKLLISAAVLALAMGICQNAYAANTQITMQINNSQMIVNGDPYDMDSAPLIISGRTFVPVRDITEALGGYADWDADTKTAHLVNGVNEVSLTIGSYTAYLNDIPYELDEAPVIVKGRTMLPLRFIAESFGFETDWDNETKIIYITKEEYDDEGFWDGENTYVIDHAGDDGRIYVETDAYMTVMDEYGNEAAKYYDTSIFERKYLDSSGNEYILVSDYDNTFRFICPDGSYYFITGDPEIQADTTNGTDLDGNTYYDLWGGEMTVTDGEGTNYYTATGEMAHVYSNADGEEARYITMKDGEYVSGFLDENGIFTEFIV